MITIKCPRCRSAIEVDESRRTRRGKIRVKCRECGAKLSMRPRGGDAAAGPPPDAPAGSPGDRAPTPPPPEDEGTSGRHAVVIENLDLGADLSGLHEVLLTLPGFRDHPNRLSELATRAPYVVAGLSPRQAGAIRRELERVVALFSAGPEREVLVGPLRSYRSDEPDAPRSDPPAGDDAFGLGGDLSEGEIALPGDPDEEDDVQYEFDEDAGSGDDLGGDGLEGNPGTSGSLDAEVSDESLLSMNAPDAHEAEGDSSAFGMSMEMEVPVRTGRRSPSGEQPSAEARPAPAGDAPSRMVVSNLADLDGYRLEPLGLVTHTFCRRGGGEGIEAKKRIHAFGTRYRKALADLAEQAQALGGNTVLGVEIQMQPTGAPDDTVVWVVVQGTAARRTEL